MNDNVTFLQAEAAPQLEPIIAADQAYTLAWQQGELKFAATIQESLERHMNLLEGCRTQLARKAQRLAAELTPDPLGEAVQLVADGYAKEALSVAKASHDEIKVQLNGLISYLSGERNAVSALPELSATADSQRLLKLQQSLAASEQQLRDEHARESAKAEKVVQAVAALEANGLETRFGGVVPKLEDLQKLAVPGGKEAVALEMAAKAIEDLKVLLSDLIEGMRYSQLQQERRAVQERVHALEAQLRELGQRQDTQVKQLKALETVAPLVELRQAWGKAVDRLVHSLQAQQASLGAQAPATASDITALRQTFTGLLTYVRALIEQHTSAL